MVSLLPHNRYLLGCSIEGADDRWMWGKPGEEPQDVYLYDDEKLSLGQDGLTTISLSGDAVTTLKNALLSQMEPPGYHLSTVLILRGFMKDHAAFADDFPFQNEAVFVRCLNEDEVLRKCYWTLRFALARGEFDTMTRLKAWIKAGPELFDAPENGMKIWFSILDLPNAEVQKELAELSFSREDLQRMIAQQNLPIYMFNKRSGYLMLSRFGKNDETGFRLWAFLPTALWGQLRERRRLSLRELALALWGQHDIEQALEERARYARGLEDIVSLTQT